MSKITVGTVLLTVTARQTGGGPYAFDWNKTHIHNPDWPPHAKFHNAQTMSLGAALCAAALTALWGRGRWTKRRLQVAAGAASMYWATQLSASAYPGVAMTDPPAPTPPEQTSDVRRRDGAYGQRRRVPDRTAAHTAVTQDRGHRAG